MTKVKICGLSTGETMQAALDAGADFVGLVFFPKSPRNVSISQAAELAALARGRAEIVALTVDADDALISTIMRDVRPDWLQLHGGETPDRVAAVRKLSGAQIIKAIKVGGPADVAQAAAFAGVADLLLFDAKAPAALKDPLPGGNGVTFDWSLLEGKSGFMLSGGLNCANMAQALAATGAPMVDVSSGVESAPGVKDVTLIRKFIEAAQAAR